MKEFSKFAAAFLILICVGMVCKGAHPKHRDEYFYNRSVKLLSNNGDSLCSGEQVRAPSGKDYVLTAAHCRPLAYKGRMQAFDEAGKRYSLAVIQEDRHSDLLLLSGIPHLKGLEIAKDQGEHDIVRTFTHGARHNTYRTEGAILETVPGDIPVGPPDACPQMPKFKVKAVETPFGAMEACVMVVPETFTTAMIRPGSSGGMVVNERDELTGVVSAGDGTYGLLVRLADINRFLSKR